MWLTAKVDRVLEHGWLRAALPARLLHGFCAGAVQELRNTRLYSIRFTCRRVEKFSGLRDLNMKMSDILLALPFMQDHCPEAVRKVPQLHLILKPYLWIPGCLLASSKPLVAALWSMQILRLPPSSKFLSFILPSTASSCHLRTVRVARCSGKLPSGLAYTRTLWIPVQGSPEHGSLTTNHGSRGSFNLLRTNPNQAYPQTKARPQYSSLKLTYKNTSPTTINYWVY